MQDTVDQACGAVPRTLANIIEDACREAECATNAASCSSANGPGTARCYQRPGRNPGPARPITVTAPSGAACAAHRTANVVANRSVWRGDPIQAVPIARQHTA
jgi:hypothetical protein